MSEIGKTEFDKIIKQTDWTKFANKTILLTGANGLIGSYLTEFLCYLNQSRKTNIKILALSRSKDKLIKRVKHIKNYNDYISIIEHDLNNPITTELKGDYIIHLASNAHPLAYSKDPVGTMKTNLIGTISLLELATKENSRFLYVSSGEIYGNNRDEKGFIETDTGLINTLDLRSCYPESKRAAETLCVAYHHQYGTKTNIARLCYVYGGNITDTNSRADAQFLRNAIAGKNIIMKSSGEQLRTYCYVADAVCGIIKIITDADVNETFNIANPNSIVSIREYAETLANISGVKLVFAEADKTEKRGYSKSVNSILDATKLINLGWQPIYNLEKGLRNTYLTAKKDKTND